MPSKSNNNPQPISSASADANLFETWWKQYEKQVFEEVSSQFLEYRCVFRDTTVGIYSKVERQLDIAVWHIEDASRLHCLIDAKYRSRPLDVTDIEGFLGMMEDVQAESGLLVTTLGFTAAARSRVENAGLALKVVEGRIADDGTIRRWYWHQWGGCYFCNQDEEHLGRHISWSTPDVSVTETGDIVAGQCNVCGGLHMKCKCCGAVTPIDSAELGEHECAGGCGLIVEYRRTETAAGDEESIHIIRQGKVVTERRLGF